MNQVTSPAVLTVLVPAAPGQGIPIVTRQQGTEPPAATEAGKGRQLRWTDSASTSRETRVAQATALAPPPRPLPGFLALNPEVISPSSPLTAFILSRFHCFIETGQK